jgi:PAS domain S-box-containing protein
MDIPVSGDAWDRGRRSDRAKTPADSAPFYQALMEGVTDYAVLFLDPDGYITTWNAGARKLKGYEAGEIIGYHFSVFYTPEDIAAGVPERALACACAEGKVEEESLRVRRDGSRFWASQVIAPVYGKDGALLGFIKVTRDITERKEADAAILDYVDRLTRSNQELDDFAYIASHDLKEPIRGLSNNSKFLLEDYADAIDDGGKRRLNRMVYLCQRMESLVDDLLYYSRLSRQELAVQKADLNVIVRDVELMMEASLLERGAEIVIPKPLPNLTCDVPRVTELFRNLITNAVKYNDKAKKRVEIGVSGVDEKTAGPIFYVRDNGIGIEQRFFSDIFRIFKRLNEEDDSVKGTGVGLTFVKKIVERHGGRIWLESEPGAGTTFYFTLKNLEGA